MKTSISLFAGLLFLVLIASCDGEGNEVSPASSEIEIKAKLKSGNAEAVENSTTATIVFSGDEIVSYNKKSGEIVFKGTAEDKNPLSLLEKYQNELGFYKDGKLLFSLKSRIVLDIANAVYNEPVLHFSTIDGDKCYIRDGNPWGLPVDDDSERTGQAASVAKERRANAEKIRQGWKIFIEELKKEGKYID